MGRENSPEKDLADFNKRQASQRMRDQMAREGKIPSSQNCPRCRMPMEHCGKGRKSVEICNFCRFGA